MHTIIVNVIDATNMKDTEIIGKQDPYVEVKSNVEMKRTRVIYEAGKNASILILILITNRLERRTFITGTRPIWNY